MLRLFGVRASHLRRQGCVVLLRLRSVRNLAVLGRRRSVLEGLLKVGNDVVNVLRADRNADEVLRGGLLALGLLALVAYEELTSLTPEVIFSSSESCSWVVVQGLRGVSHYFPW